MSDRGPSHAPPGPAARGFSPGGRLEGDLHLAGSKSLAQRALVAAAPTGGATRIANLPEADDVRAALALVETCGAGVDRTAPRARTVRGVPPGPHRGWSAEGGAVAGESGTLARLATAALALCGRTGVEHELRVEGSLRRRASPALFAALERTGARLASEGPAGSWPVRVRSIGPPSELVLDRPTSSQEVSALLIALAAWPDEALVRVNGAIPSRPYVDMTLAVLADFGVPVEASREGDEERFLVGGPLTAPAAPLAIEPDASSAAVALAAACLSGGRVRVPRLGATSRQGDVRIVEHLARFGCRAGADADALFAEGAPTTGAELDLEGEPDLAPVLAAVAAHVARDRGTRSVLVGLGTLPGKESSRIEVLAGGLRAIGLHAEAGDDRLAVGPGASATPSAPLDPRGDHRMAFAFALLGLFVPGVRVLDPGCVAKSWPGFWDDLERLGARPA